MKVEPSLSVVPRSTIPPADRLNLDKGYWDAVVRRMRLLPWGEVLHIELPRGHAECGRSSLHNAAAKAGTQVSILIRRDGLYAWLTGRREPARTARPPRKPIRCRACGREVQRPHTGAGRQYLCPGKLGRRSACQVVVRTAALRGCSLDEAKRRSPKWQKERG